LAVGCDPRLRLVFPSRPPARLFRYVHSHNDFPPLEYEPLEKAFVRNYITVAKRYQPVISEDLVEYITGVYINMREEAQTDTEIMTFVSIRTLLGILRLASALARLRFSNNVDQVDVDEALRLIHMSKVRGRPRPGLGGSGSGSGSGSGNGIGDGDGGEG